MIAESLRNQNSVLPAGSIDTQSDRVLVRVSGQFTSLDDIRNVPIAAGGRHDQARRLHHRHARLRGSAHLHRAAQRPAGADARHRDDRRRQHRRARQGDRARRRQDPVRAAVRHRARARRGPAEHRKGRSLGIRALAHGSARHRARGEPGEPRLAHGHRRRPRRAARARRGGDRDARHGLEPRARVARIAHHRARAARRRRDHRGRDDGGEDGGGLGPAEGRRLLLRGDRLPAPHRGARHGRGVHADRAYRNP